MIDCQLTKLHTLQHRENSVCKDKSNDHAICKNLCSSPTYDQWSVSAVTRFPHSAMKPQCYHLCLNKLANSYQEGTHVTKQKFIAYTDEL